MTAIGDGDLMALAELYDRFGQLAYRLAAALSPDGLHAEKVVHDAFLTVWRYAREDRAGASVVAWLLNLVHRSAISTRRVEADSRRTSPLVV